jgi:hypothetical protein
MLFVFVASAVAGEQGVKSRILSLGMFKNGLTVVKRVVEIPGAGTYRIDDVPNPVHGTFWVESKGEVEARVSEREIEAPLKAKLAIDFQEELAGKEVRIHFRDGDIPPVTGKVLKILPLRGEEAWNRSYQQPTYRYYNSPYNQSPTRRFLLLGTNDGQVYVDLSMITFVKVEDESSVRTEKKAVLLLTAKGEGRVIISYLTKGISWAPSYRADITDTQKLTIGQKAVIKNELCDIEKTEMYLISGFPNIKFAHVTSPLSLKTTWANFFQQLNQRFRPGHGANRQVLSNYAQPPSPGNQGLPAVPPGEGGADVHYQPIGKKSIGEGDSMSLDIASGEAEYERIVEWIVPDTRNADGSYIQEYERNNDPEKYRDAAWDAIRFTNPLPFPMTTAPAMIVGHGNFLGQQLSKWVNKGEKTTVHITKALSIRTRNVEHEEAGKRKKVYVGGDDYYKTIVKGELSLKNHRKEKIKIVIRRRFSGDLIEADDKPKCDLREEGAWAVNKRNELTWTLTLKPGAEKNLTYRYWVLVNR